jgi:chlorobactene lauroyltransferase
MLEAKKSKWFQNIFSIYNRNLLRRRFNAFKINGINNLQNLPIVVYANHSSWWDGLVAFQLCRKANVDIYAMMEEKQVLEYPFHRKIGAFSVVRENPRDAVKAINYAADLLKEKRLVWIFPQGKIMPNDVRPIEFFNGVSRIVEKSGQCFTAPIAIRYEFFGDWKPEILVKIGEPQVIKKPINSKDLTKQFAENLTQTLDELKSDIVTNQLSDYKNII